jgi:hypothetical protein
MAVAASRAQAGTDMKIPLLVAWSIASPTDLVDAPRVNRRAQGQRAVGIRSRAPDGGHRGEPRQLAKDPARSAQSSGQLGQGQVQSARVHSRPLGPLTRLEPDLLRRSSARRSQALPLPPIESPSPRLVEFSLGQPTGITGDPGTAELRNSSPFSCRRGHSVKPVSRVRECGQLRPCAEAGAPRPPAAVQQREQAELGGQAPAVSAGLGGTGPPAPS